MKYSDSLSPTFEVSCVQPLALKVLDLSSQMASVIDPRT